MSHPKSRRAPSGVPESRRRSPARWAALVLLLVMAVSSAASPSAVAGGRSVLLDGHEDAMRFLPASAGPDVAEGRDRVVALRQALSTDRFVTRVTGLLRTGAGVIPAAPSLPLPGNLDLTRTSSLPTALREPVAKFSAAVRAASKALGGRAPGKFRFEARGLLTSLAGSRPLAEAVQPARRDFLGRHVPGLAMLGPDQTSSLPGTAVRHRDAKTSRAALLIAAALDQYLPALRTWQGSLKAGASVDGCDLVDRTPYLCVGSDADNLYTESEMLLVDLGGNDTYQNSAGGAPFLPEPASPLALQVSVNVDLAGSDLYSPTHTFPVFASTPYVVAEGAGVYGAVGVAVDEEGDDTHAVQAPSTEGGQVSAVLAQGAGGLGGFGALFDLQGSDSYSIKGSSGVDDLIALAGQGAGGCCNVSPKGNDGGAAGYGALVDTGEGDDHYGLSGGSVEKRTIGGNPRPTRFVFGQGTSYAGTGVLYDDGGGDSVVASAAGLWVPGEVEEGPTVFQEPNWINDNAPLAQIEVQGRGYAGGLGVLLEGVGDTTYSAQVQSEGEVQSAVFGQGSGQAGIGLLDDRGGNDTYLGRAAVEYEPELVIDHCLSDTEGEDAPCKPAEAAVHENVGMISLFMGQGAAFGGVGLLEDHGGDDSYSAADEYHLKVTLRDEIPYPSGPPSLEVWSSFWQPELIAQGAADTAGVGVLLDHSGTDSYSARYLKETEASANSAHAAGEPVVRAVSWFRVREAAQGGNALLAGIGALLDLAGSGDSFEASATLRSRTAPDPDGALQAAPNWPHFHGSGDEPGAGVFVALGQQPRIVSSPSQVVCPLTFSQRRGFGRWGECSTQSTGMELATGTNPTNGETAGVDLYGRAAGFAPNASLPKTLPWLGFTSDTPTSATAGGGPVPVGVQLRDVYQGKPIPGAPIHFDLQWRPMSATQQPGTWHNAWEIDAVTDANGIAQGRVPLVATESAPSTWQWRVLATYDGGMEANRYPAHLGSPLSLTSP